MMLCSVWIFFCFGYRRHDVPASELMRCDFYVKKGMRGHDLRRKKNSSRFPHLIFWEFPLIWRNDPVVPERVWGFVNWDHLNG